MNLSYYKKQAKRLHHAARAGETHALSRIKSYFDEPDAVGLQNVQLVIAREAGFQSWSKLRAGIGRPKPTAMPKSCLHGGDPLLKADFSLTRRGAGK